MRDLDRAAWRIYARRNPVADPTAPAYLLPPREGRRIFCEEIVPELLAGPESRMSRWSYSWSASRGPARAG